MARATRSATAGIIRINTGTDMVITREIPGRITLPDRAGRCSETISATAQGLMVILTVMGEIKLQRRGFPSPLSKREDRHASFLSFKEERMKKFTMSILLLLLMSPYLLADSLSLSFYQYMTDNLFQNRYAEPDQLSIMNLYFDKGFSNFSFFSEGNYTYLFENPGLAYYVHDLGLDYLYLVNEKTALYFSLGGRGAFYRTDYSDFNYLSFNFFSSLKTYFSQTSIFKSNYSLEYRNYKYSLFDFLGQTLSVSLDKYFQTRTTLKAEASWGYKHFFHPYLSEEVIPADLNQYQHGGKGKGGGYAREGIQFITGGDDEGEGIQVFSLAGLIAQGLGNRVGLSLTGMKQWTLSGENPFTYVEEYYTVENPSYDRYSWAGYQLGSQLTALLPWNIQLKMGYTISNKEFPGIESMSLEEEPSGLTRKDERKQFEARLEKNFPRLSVFLSYSYIDNQSNDPFFEWKGHFFSAGIEWNLYLGERK
jgi:hypothetical protein